MKSNVVIAVLACCLSVTTARAAELTFVQPDGTPAAGTKFYRSFLEAGGYEMDMMMMGMGSGYEGMGDDSYGAGGGETMSGGAGMMPGGDDMGAMDEMYGMGMGMEMGDMQQPQENLAFLNGAPLQPMAGQSGELLTCDENGKVELEANRARRQIRFIRHSHFGLAVHESGFSFIPAGTKFSPQVTLRRGGSINVTIDEGIDTSKYQVLTCWQNGFAYPSLAEYVDRFDSAKVGMEMQPKLQIDQDDWRFKARFRWFQTAPLGETFSVPPGEVRVTIVPMQVNGRSTGEMNADELLELLIAGGPSVIHLFTETQKETVFHKFTGLRSLVCRLPQGAKNELPLWGDQPHNQYHLKRFTRSNTTEPFDLAEPTAVEFASRVAFTEFLNKQRSARSTFQEMRVPTVSQVDHARFDLLSPGWYQIEKLNDDGSSTLGIPIIKLWESGKGESTAVLAGAKVQGVDGAFELAMSNQGIATFRSDEVGIDAGAATIDRQRTDAEKLKLVTTLRREVDEAIARMVEHRNRLHAIEVELRGNNHLVDPFGGGAAGTDPFGGGGVGPDPFGGGGAAAGSDPFGGVDPFGN
ncbi:MAG: hypothetical protein KDB00_15235 [Planctomycetales bacterium]|nr:hypothetical protein [Planctomycetales bacterium]